VGKIGDYHQNCQFLSKDAAPYSELIALVSVWLVGRSFDRSVGQWVSPWVGQWVTQSFCERLSYLLVCF